MRPRYKETVSDASARHADLRGANLTRIVLAGAHLIRTDFRDTTHTRDAEALSTGGTAGKRLES